MTIARSASTIIFSNFLISGELPAQSRGQTASSLNNIYYDLYQRLLSSTPSGLPG
jgi:hypothetical protein